MASRTYDRILKCGCMYSSDGGGGLMPCNYGYGCGEEGCGGNCPGCQKQRKLCEEAHREWHKSEDYKQYKKECIEKNG